MTLPSDDFDDLTSDVYQLKTLIETATNKVVEIIDPNLTQCQQTKAEIQGVSHLLCIALDMITVIAENTEACHNKVLTREARK